MSLQFPTFRPHPLIRGGHLQTILGCYLPWRQVEYGAVQRHVSLPDGDQVVLHDDLPASAPRPVDGVETTHCEGQSAASTWQAGDPVVLLLHGLGGCHQSGYMLRCAAKLTARGLRVFRMDLRGYGAGFPLARHPIHAGRSEDAAAALDYVMQLCPDSPVHLVGFSLGANIVLKLAGELGMRVPANLTSVMAVSPPIDLLACSRNMQRATNRLYDRNFVKNLLAHVDRRRVQVPGALTRPLDPRTRRLVEFDNQFTAPLSGFQDAHDYYQQASAGPLLKHIAVPTLIVAAANDPIIPVTPFEKASYSAATQLLITPCGGHLGFIGRPGIDPDRRWLDWRVIQWIESQTALRPPTPSVAGTKPGPGELRVATV